MGEIAAGETERVAHLIVREGVEVGGQRLGGQGVREVTG